MPRDFALGPHKAESQSVQSQYVDLIQRTAVESITRAAADKRHGKDQIIITYYAGEIRQVEIVPSTVYKI